MVGTIVSHYRIIDAIGAGGMGVVYLAEDRDLNRKVALKFLPPSVALDLQAHGRFLREAQAASALDHPNVATIFEVGQWQQQLFIAMAFYDGETLRQRLDRGPMDVPEAVSIATQIAAGLAAAHRAGIVHRDLKPANVMLSRNGLVKILDFGVAKVISDVAATIAPVTAPGTAIGTIAYMAPEQAQGADVDHRADIWAFGVVLYEMLAGRLPFNAATPAATLVALIHDAPVPLRRWQPGLPPALLQIVDRALEKSLERRTPAMQDIINELARLQAGGSVTAPPVTRSGRSVRWIAASLLVAIVAAFAGRTLWQSSRARWAREEAVPEIERLIEQENTVAAFRLAESAKPYIPTDPVWTRLEPIVSRSVSVSTTPSGASVSYRPYRGSESDWVTLGKSPLTNVRVPNTFFVWKAEKPGFVTATDAAGFGTALAQRQLTYVLSKPQQVPPGMTHVIVGDAPYGVFIPGLDHLPPVKLLDFWIDQFEVTNRDFKRFVDAGGYRTATFWKEPFVRNGTSLTFDQAIALLADATGRPGPATWELGTYPEGQDDFPVTGVSWYEAAAYAAFAGKSLPTLYHWSFVAEQRSSTFVVPHSNFGGQGPAKVGSAGAINRFGAFDLAGNVKEWCWNRADASKRYILGGAWDEPVYMFNDPDARSPFERGANFGFRTVKYAPDEALTSSGAELVAFEARDFRKDTPVNGQVFDAYRRLYAYDHTDLHATVDARDDSNPEWVRERVSFAAAYGNERVPAFLYLPKNAKPPYQTVVYFPGSQVLQQRSSAQIGTRAFDWLIRSGRAVIYPVYKSTFERGDEVITDFPSHTNTFRDHVLMWSKDVGRAIDYLETRPDIASDRVAYLGASWGAAMGPIFVAVEPRFKTALFVLAGFYLQRSSPEVDAFNFAPRVKVPSLMLDGRFDFFVPTDTSQEPMFMLLGAPAAQKRRVVYDTGHNIPRPDLVRETVDWLDRYLGSVIR